MCLMMSHGNRLKLSLIVMRGLAAVSRALPASLLLCSVFAIIGCSNETPEPSATPAAPCGLVLDAEFPEYARAGTLKGVHAGIGDAISRFKSAYGEPEATGVYQTKYEQYGKCFVFPDQDQRAGSILVALDQPAERVRAILGPPAFEGMSEAGWEEYVLQYSFGDFDVYVNYEQPESAEGSLLIKRSGGNAE